jgi:hypothetical protein
LSSWLFALLDQSCWPRKNDGMTDAGHKKTAPFGDAVKRNNPWHRFEKTAKGYFCS